MRLKDKVAIVTGGGGGLGEGICLRLAQEGTHVVVSDIKLDLAEKVVSKIRERGRKSYAIQTDVRIADQCQYLIDILVCNAGVSGYVYWGNSKKAPVIENISEEEWNLTIDVNLKGVFLCNRAIAPYFKHQKRGRIINISSISGRIGQDWLAHYCASKAGVIVLTQGVALQLAPYNINVNTICPGSIWTPMWEQGAKMLSQSSPTFKGMNPYDLFQNYNKKIPLGRSQTPEDIGNAVVFFASDEAKEITGQALNVDGGMVFN
jgi:NAD(P)-dependent dehydrogenase (short-subunit alcohol dehydrogenase family)